MQRRCRQLERSIDNGFNIDAVVSYIGQMYSMAEHMRDLMYAAQAAH